MLTQRVRRALDAGDILYGVVPHHEVFTAQEAAETSHVPARRLAKVLIARERGSDRYLMIVLPASCRVDLATVREAAGTGRLLLATEEELGWLFPDCDTGAMPPFGNLYGLPVYVDDCFPRQGNFFFQAGNHQEIIRIRYEEFERLVQPVIGEFCLHEREPAEAVL